MISQSAHIIRRIVPAAVLLAVLAGCASAPPQETRRAGSGPSAQQASTPGAVAADIALSQVGMPYRYGGTSPGGFDCSGLIYYSYRKAGRSVPRTTSQLWASVTPVERRDLRAGDVLFFNIDGKMSHVGLYVGGSRFVHAPSSGKTVSVASLNSDFYRQAFIRAGRPK